MKRTLTALLLTLSFWTHAETLTWTSPENYRLRADLAPAGPTAVVIIHGTGGPDIRGKMYAEELNRAGITALVVDFKTGIYTDGRDRNRHRFIPMLRSAIDQLKARGYDRIGVMGTSLGGVITVHAKLEASGIDARSFVALYPNCSLYIEGGWWPRTTQQAVKPGPIMIMYGTLDDQPEAEACPKMQKQTAHWSSQYIAYPGARHGFDRNAPTWTVPEPSSPTGTLTLEYNAEATRDAVPRIVKFFKETL